MSAGGVIALIIFSGLLLYIGTTLHSNVESFYADKHDRYWGDRDVCTTKDWLGYTLPFGEQSCTKLIPLIVLKSIVIAFLTIAVVVSGIFAIPESWYQQRANDKSPKESTESK